MAAAGLVGITGLALTAGKGPHWLVGQARSLVDNTRGHSSLDRFSLQDGPTRAFAASSAVVPATTFGVDLSPPASTESFANLALGPDWILRRPGAQNPMPPELLDENGDVKSLPAGGSALRWLTSPGGDGRAISIRCTYTGKGNVEVGGPSVTRVYNKTNELRIDWVPSKDPAGLSIREMDPNKPVRNLDCRNIETAPAARFAPRFLELIKGFKVLRFMDWQNTNADLPVTWAGRHTAKSMVIDRADGVSLEDMVLLARLNHSDAWFNMPSRADDDYILHFAQYVHANLPAEGKVYVELGNEVWNWGFPVSRHVMQEGLDAHLGGSAKEAISFRYAERLIHVMDIWASVFQNDPHRLVRIASGQSVDPYRSGLILGYKDVPKHVDAFATAPYFGYDKTGDPRDLTEIFHRIDAGVETALQEAEMQKAIAAKHGLRFIAYESGQGIVLQDIALNERIQRDPRMYTAYRHYIDGWRKRVGDTFCLFGTVFRIRNSGAWGLLEYEGQPAAGAPKYRAVREELAH